MSWNYKGKKIKDLSDFPPNSFGFVYLVIHKPTNKKYIGKKVLYFSKKVKIGKKELKSLLSESKAKDFTRSILKIVPSKKLLTYFETKYQMVYQVLEKPDEFFNDNILGKFYTKDFDEIEYEDPLEIDEI